MKISYRNHPIIEKLNNNSLGVMPMYEVDKPSFELWLNYFTPIWKRYTYNFKKDINVISKPFAFAAEKALPKLIELWKDITTNDLSDMDISGTYIFGEFVYFIDYHIKKGSEDNELIFYKFHKTGIPDIVFIDSVKLETYNTMWISKTYNIDVKDEEKIKNIVSNSFIHVIIFNMFKSFASIETKILFPHKKIKEIYCKYINDTDLQLTYLDSKWFTNLIKSDAFKVRGHFRLQPKIINDKWTKKLIWISDFTKKGYTSKARKLMYNE